MCRVLGLSQSGYYAWRKRHMSRRVRRDLELTVVIRAAHARSDGSYAAPQLLSDLRDAGHLVVLKRIARLLRVDWRQSVSSCRGPASPKRATLEAPPAPDLVPRLFRATAPNQLWVADITYIPTAAGSRYFAIVLDVFSRRVVGWCMRDTLHSGIAVDALNMVAMQRRATEVIHHSDQGSQGGFNRSSQQQVVRQTSDVRLAPRLASSILTSCAAYC